MRPDGGRVGVIANETTVIRIGVNAGRCYCRNLEQGLLGIHILCRNDILGGFDK